MTCRRLRRSEKSQSLRIGPKLHRMVLHMYVNDTSFVFFPISSPFPLKGGPPPLKGNFSYLWSDFAEIWHEWPLHQWEMTEMVKLMITHIFRPPPSPKNCIFLIYGPILIRFGMNGPDINGI